MASTTSPATDLSAATEQLDLNDWNPVSTQLPKNHHTVVTVMGETHQLAVWNLPKDQETKKEKQVLYLPGVKAFSLHWDHVIPMFKKSFWLTGKTDGIRALLKIERHAVYLLSRTAGVWRMKNRKAEKEFLDAIPNTLLDGELLPTPTVITAADGTETPGPSQWNFKAFDCVQFKGTPVAHFNFKARYNHVQECVRIVGGIVENRSPELQAELDDVEKSGGVWIHLTTKLWVPAVRISEVLSQVYMIDDESQIDESKEALGLHRTDGLILMDPASHYKHHERSQPLLKWKPKHTIDLIGFFHRKSDGHVYCPKEDEDGLGQTGEFVRLYEYVVVRGNRGPTPGARQFHCVAEENVEEEWLEYVGSAPVNDLWRSLVKHYSQPGVEPRNCLVMEVDLDSHHTGKMEMILPRPDKKTAPNWNQVVKDTLHSVDEHITLPELTYVFHHAQDICPGSFVGSSPPTDVLSKASASQLSSNRKRGHAETTSDSAHPVSSSNGAPPAPSSEETPSEGPAKRLRMADGKSVPVPAPESAPESRGSEEEKKTDPTSQEDSLTHEIVIPDKPPFQADRRWLELTKQYDPDTKLFLHLAALMLEHWRGNTQLEFEARLCRQNKTNQALDKRQFHEIVLPALLKDPAWQQVNYQLIYEESRKETSGKVRVADIRSQKAWYDKGRRRWMIPALQNPQPQGNMGGSPNTPGLPQLLHGASRNAVLRQVEVIRKSDGRLQQLDIPGSPWAVRLSTKKEQPMPKLQAQVESDVKNTGQPSHGGPNFLTGSLGLAADGYRHKARWSFIRKGIRYDISEVTSQGHHGQQMTYEAEVELQDELRHHKDGLQPPKESELYGMSHLILAQRFFFKVEYILKIIGQQQQQRRR